MAHNTRNGSEGRQWLLFSLEGPRAPLPVFAPPSQNGNTPLYAAAERGHTEVVKALLAAPSVLPNQPNNVRPPYGRPLLLPPCPHPPPPPTPNAARLRRIRGCLASGVWVCRYFKRERVRGVENGVVCR